MQNMSDHIRKVLFYESWKEGSFYTIPHSYLGVESPDLEGLVGAGV